MQVHPVNFDSRVNCRIGSLESKVGRGRNGGRVNCRIGSLEIPTGLLQLMDSVNCRIGSLEMLKPWEIRV